MLQVRAKPLIFLLIWLVLSLAPQLMLSYAFEKPVSDMMDTSFQIINETMTIGDSAFVMTPEVLEIFSRGARAIAVMMAVLFLTEIYLGSVLAGVVRQYRNRTLPVFKDSLQNGITRFPGFLKAVIISVFRIIAKPVAVFIVAVIIGSLLNQPVFIYFFFFVSGILLLMGLMRFGLGPFIHLSLGTSGRESAVISKTYYLSHRPVVSLLFMFIILLPMVIVSMMMNLLISLELYSGAGGMTLGIFQSLLQLTMTVVTINFAMNNFMPQDWGVGNTPDIQ